ncbi:MAG TPA: hypothetical protein VMU22_01115 [Rhizomicrobium sp.]|nr:hypothetical protein [Rhizomicrobium sp.]
MTIANIASIASSLMAQQLQSSSGTHHRGGHHSASTQSQNSSAQINSLSSLLNVIPKSVMSPVSATIARMPGFSTNPNQSPTNVTA